MFGVSRLIRIWKRVDFRCSRRRAFTARCITLEVTARLEMGRQLESVFVKKFLNPWLPNKIFRKCYLAPINFFISHPWRQIKFSVSHSWRQIKFDRQLFCRPPTVWFYFLKKVSVLCKRAVYLFCRELNSLQDGENSI